MSLNEEYSSDFEELDDFEDLDEWPEQLRITVIAATRIVEAAIKAGLVKSRDEIISSLEDVFKKIKELAAEE
ncbi:MAG: hypothetical protein QXS68_08445 [Candidatus Methanomethylicaceae archaeon]